MAKRGVNLQDLESSFISKRFEMRGRKYTITELSAKAYDKTVKQATKVDEDTKLEDFDSEAHQALLVARAVTVDGRKIDDVDELREEIGNRAWRQLVQEVLRVHLDPEPIKDLSDDEDDDEGEAAKASSSETAS